MAKTPAPREVRKTVTVLFSDVVGSTNLGEQLDPESLRRVMTRYFDELRAVLERHGGTVEKFIGDAVMAVFGIPHVHEDDAVRAVRAADEMREALAALNKELDRDWGVTITNRTGVNTGPVVAGDPDSGQTLVTGDTVNVAARLEQAAPHGEVLIGRTTYRLVRDAIDAEPVEALSLKGKSEPVPAYRLVRVIPGAEGHARRLDTPMVGRVRERTLLEQAFDRVVSERGCHLFTIMGPAGVGKSRLTSEFLIGVGDRATIVRGRCLPYGDGITFWPVAEVVRQALSLSDLDGPSEVRAKIETMVGAGEKAPLVAERLEQMIGLGGGTSAVLETFWAVRKLFEALAREHPLVVVLDDINWGETAFLDLIEYVAEWSAESPILLLCQARPDLIDVRPGWGGGRVNATSILLEPLSEAECEELVANLLGEIGIPQSARSKILEAAEGTPLFVEEMLGMLIDDGVLIRGDNGWEATADLASISVPPTIEALLAARLDRLDEIERAVIERAAVVGKVFYSEAVRELSTGELAGLDVDRALMSLSRKELIRPARSDLGGDDAFRFRHILIRDAAYASMPKELRAELHERCGAWLEQTSGERLAEVEEVVAHHLEQAYRYREQLRPVDERDLALAARASGHLVTVAHRARARGDGWAVIKLLERAVDLVPVDDPAHMDLLLELGAVLREFGDYVSVDRIFADAFQIAESRGDELGMLHATVGRMRAQLVSNAEGAPTADQALAVSEQGIETFGRVGHDPGLARALLLMGDAHAVRFQNAPALAAYERSLEVALRSGEVLEAFAARRNILWVLVESPTSIVDCWVRLEAFLDEAAGNLIEETMLLRSLALVAAMDGRFDDARALLSRRWGMVEEIGATPNLIVGQAETSGWVGLLAGDPMEAERAFTPGYDELKRMGDRGVLSSFAAALGRVALMQGRDSEAVRLTNESEELASPDDAFSQVLWRGVRAIALIGRGQPYEAEHLASEAVRLALETDGPNLQGTAFFDLAEVFRQSGRDDAAIDAAIEALERFQTKGNVAMASQVRGRFAELASP